MFVIFLTGQLIFILIDGTIFEPNVNHIGSFVTNAIEGKFDWFTLYHSPFLKFVSLLFFIIVIGTGVKNILVYLFHNRS